MPSSTHAMIAAAVAALCCLGPCARGAEVPAATPADDGFNRQGLVLWLDASQAGTVARDAAGAVVGWTDRNGGRRSATRAAGAPGPRFVEHAMNGLPVLRFGGKDHLEIPPIRETAGEVTVFIVAQRQPAQAGGEGWQRWLSSDGGAENDDRAPSFALHDGARGAQLDPTVLEKHEGGVEIARMSLGRNQRMQGNYLQGDIAEILVFDRDFIAEGQIREVRQYLSRKWGAKNDGASRGWTRKGDLPDRPARTTDAYPLSDQGNAGGWVRYEPMCDEFAGDALDAAKWWDHNPRWKGRPPAPFLARNLRVENGELCLTMAAEPGQKPDGGGFGGFSSAAVQSRTRVKYGYFETRAKPMRSHGSSGFWLYYHDATEHTEIDIFELGAGAPKYERYYHMGLHVFHSPTAKPDASTGDDWQAPWNLADDYHIFGLDWNEKTIDYFVDGVLVRRVDNAAWHQALTLNFDSETMPGWFGMPDAKELPSTYRIDYSRVWRKPAMEPALPGFE
jgi:hypothetical protein